MSKCQSLHRYTVVLDKIEWVSDVAFTRAGFIQNEEGYYFVVGLISGKEVYSPVYEVEDVARRAQSALLLRIEKEGEKGGF